ncbi:MAG: hypothetical protein IIA27_10670 [Gemmatimonadetes bacterium]|nr:hypothetical protein [Gemmatimonadota bacterium]
MGIAAHPPEDAAALARIRGVSRGFAEGKGGKALVAAVARALALPDHELPRRKRTKQTASMTADARDINPKDTGSLMALPIDVLEELSQEELVSTDESIRKARAELDRATAEFGAERTRSFVRARSSSSRRVRSSASMFRSRASRRLRPCSWAASLLALPFSKTLI